MRGEKFCPAGHRCGPRSWSCPTCGHGFLVKGIQHQNIDPKELVEIKKDAQQGAARDERIKLKALLVVCNEPEEVRIRTHFYGVKAKTWQSLDGKHRIRLGKEIMGVNVGERPYKLLHLRKGMFEPVKSFKKIWHAVKYMLKLQNGVPVTAPTITKRTRMKRKVI